MKQKIVIVVLATAAIALLFALFATKKRGDERHASDVSSILDFSNQVVTANLQIVDLKQVNLALTNDLAQQQQQSAQFSNRLAAANTALAETTLALTLAQQQVSGLTTQVADLESQNKILDQRAQDLTNAIVLLNQSIEQTRAQLTTTLGNNAYLQIELQKQMAARAEIEHKFNDLDALRAQVSKIKTDLFVARRMQLSKNDLGGKKGAQLLVTPQRPAPATAAGNQSNYGLNVEVGSDGSVRVIPPIGTTNAPAR